ncbi:hypothetical protein ACWCQ0_26240 [Streptomyces massasporeus]|uniref:hypothetical protein n=1 Tax=Streptomyces massasporeus TaxID=67324 RepID=UPI0034060EEF
MRRTPAACRRPASSARRRVRAERPPATPEARRADAVRAFRRACEDQDSGDAVVFAVAPDTAYGFGRDNGVYNPTRWTL